MIIARRLLVVPNESDGDDGKFVEAARLDQVPPGSGTTASVAGKELALFTVEGTIYAIDDSCLHQSASLGTGKLKCKVVICRDATLGVTLYVPDYGVANYPVKVVDGKIMVALDSSPAAT